MYLYVALSIFLHACHCFPIKTQKQSNYQYLYIYHLWDFSVLRQSNKSFDWQLDRPLLLAQCRWHRECCHAWTECVCEAAARRLTEECHVMHPYRQWRHAVPWRHSTSSSVAVASSNSSRRTRRPMLQWRQMSAAVPRSRRNLCSTGDVQFQFRFQRLNNPCNVFKHLHDWFKLMHVKLDTTAVSFSVTRRHAKEVWRQYRHLLIIFNQCFITPEGSTDTQ